MNTPRHAPKNLVPAKAWHFLHLAERMRPDEQRNFLALSGASTYDPEVAAAAAIGATGLRFALLHDDGTPIIAGGFEPVRGRCVDAWMMGTLEGWDREYRAISRAVRWVIAEVFAAGTTRIQVVSLADREAALDWYERALGMQCDGKLPRAGAHGEDLVIYSRLAGESSI